MCMAGIDGEENANAKKILLEMGGFFQIQDDYLDLFGDPSVMEQRQILQENYGQKEAEKVARVKALYEEMNLSAVYMQYEEDNYSHIMGLIEQCAAPLPPAIFLGLAQKIYERKK
ncbi:hypothetical protein CapIbe_012259 [Capra ibex]